MYNSGSDALFLSLSAYIRRRHQRQRMMLVLAYLLYCRALEDASASDTDSEEMVSDSISP